MLKLVRLARGSRIFKRWEMRLSINYAMLQIVNICVMLLFVCHLFACIWGLQASFDPLASWLGIKGYCVPYNATQDGPCPSNARCDEDEAWQCESAGAQYLYSLYWSIATVTSIGYGDVVATPLNISEQVICVCMMLSGSLLFAYLVGSFCGLAANLSPDVMRFRQDLTDMNKFLTANAIPPALRYQLREYMHQTVHLRHVATGNRLLSDLAPKLRNEVALQMNERWLQKIDLINDECEPGLVLELAFALALHIYPPGDSCPVGSIYIVSRGAALFAGRAYLPGMSWGEPEALLTSDNLRFPIPAMAINYLFAYSIEGDNIRATMSQLKYPDACARMRRRQLQWIIRRGLVHAANEKMRLARGGSEKGRRKSVFLDAKQLSRMMECRDEVDRRRRSTAKSAPACSESGEPAAASEANRARQKEECGAAAPRASEARSGMGSASCSKGGTGMTMSCRSLPFTLRRGNSSSSMPVVADGASSVSRRRRRANSLPRVSRGASPPPAPLSVSPASRRNRKERSTYESPAEMAQAGVEASFIKRLSPLKPGGRSMSPIQRAATPPMLRGTSTLNLAHDNPTSTAWIPPPILLPSPAHGSPGTLAAAVAASSASCHRAPDYRAPAPAAKTSNESRALDALRGEVQGEMRTLRAELGELRAARKEDGRVLREILSLLTSSGKSTSASQEHAGAVEMV